MRVFSLILSSLLVASLATASDFTDRVESYSESFLGYPYIEDGPLGEGPSGQYDKDPLFRSDGFDCTTYIESILALSLSGPYLDELISLMNWIRYSNGQPNFFTRNHFTSADWNPHLQRIGLAKDVTATIDSRAARTREILIQKSAWFQKVHEVYYTTPNLTASIDYLDKNVLLENPDILEKIPTPSIVNYVRENWMIGEKHISEFTGTDIGVSHQGFLVRKNGKLLFRHASSSKSVMAVTEEPLIDYLTRLKDTSSHVGINILQIQE